MVINDYTFEYTNYREHRVYTHDDPEINSEIMFHFSGNYYDFDLTNFLVKEGVSFEITNKERILLCNYGLHAAHRVYYATVYIPFNATKLNLVKVGKIYDDDGIKVVSDKRRVIKSVLIEDLNDAIIQHLHNDNIPVLDSVKTNYHPSVLFRKLMLFTMDWYSKFGVRDFDNLIIELIEGMDNND